MGQKADVVVAELRRTHDPSERQRINRWSEACYCYSWLLPFFDYALVNWMNHSWSEEFPPELLETVYMWAQMAEFVELVGKTTPLVVPEGREDEYAEAGMYSVELLERNVRRFSSYMHVAEENRPEDYQQLLKEQLDELIGKFRNAVTAHYDNLDYEDQDGLYEWRDQLHYAVYGIAKLQLNSDMKQLPEIDAGAYARELTALDRKFKPLHAELKRRKRNEPDDRAPESFWWRKP